MSLKRSDQRSLQIRAFIAIKLPEECILGLKSLEDQFNRDWRGISWVRPETIHLTLKFLGEIDPGRVDEIANVLIEASSGIAAFAVEIEGVGGFPNLKSPRVVWVGVKENPALAKLQQNIDEGLKDLGFEKEDRPYRPHLTLCRVKSPKDGRELGRLVEEARPNIKMDFRADSFVLFESVLSPKGARHTPLKTISLAG